MITSTDMSSYRVVSSPDYFQRCTLRASNLPVVGAGGGALHRQQELMHPFKCAKVPDARATAGLFCAVSSY